MREESTIQEIVVKHGVHPNHISQWKAQAIAGMADIFERPNKKSEETRIQEEEKDGLLKTIGEQKVEIDFLRILREINKNGGDTTETTVRRVMRRFGITAVFPGKNLSKTCKYHKKYPYLLRNKVI